MAEHIKYPSIEQFRNVVRAVQNKARYYKDENGEAAYDMTKPLPTLQFTGSVKLHGTNAGIRFQLNDPENFVCQSRERDVAIGDDNAGFAAYVHENKEEFLRVFRKIKTELLMELEAEIAYHRLSPTVIVYGEWCGGNIQKSVAINQLPKMFVLFGIKVFLTEDSWYWLSEDDINRFCMDKSHFNLHSIYSFPTFGPIEIDFNYPERSQNVLRDLTVAVEEQCPVAKALGVDGVGEGIVWKCITFPYTGSEFMFKVKGEKHSASKVRTLAAVDTERLENIESLVESLVSENRLLQGLDYLRASGLEIDQTNTGAFLKWVVGDVLKEESDTITESGFEKKDVTPFMSKKAKIWFFEQI